MRTRGSRAMVSLPPAMVTNGPPSSGAGLVKATSGTSLGLPASGKILAQREIGIALPHQDAAQVRMPAKANAHHVVNLPLVPIGRPPDGRDGRQLGLSSLTSSLEPQMAAVPEAVELVNHRPARVVAVIIDAGDVHEVVEAQLAFGEGANLRDLRSGSAKRTVLFAAKLRPARRSDSRNCALSFCASSKAVIEWLKQNPSII